jgi:hypothetical protein
MIKKNECGEKMTKRQRRRRRRWWWWRMKMVNKKINTFICHLHTSIVQDTCPKWQ